MTKSSIDTRAFRSLPRNVQADPLKNHTIPEIISNYTADFLNKIIHSHPLSGSERSNWKFYITWQDAFLKTYYLIFSVVEIKMLFLKLCYLTRCSFIEIWGLYGQVVVKQADRQASWILKMRSSKPKKFGIPIF